nr:MAG TPA: hypothetical protein [Caudoviricetes sp.]
MCARGLLKGYASSIRTIPVLGRLGLHGQYLAVRIICFGSFQSRHKGRQQIAPDQPMGS